MTNEQHHENLPEVKPYEGNVDLDLSGIDPETGAVEDELWKEEFEAYNGQKEFEEAYRAHLKDPQHIPKPNREDYVFKDTDVA